MEKIIDKVPILTVLQFEHKGKKTRIIRDKINIYVQVAISALEKNKVG